MDEPLPAPSSFSFLAALYLLMPFGRRPFPGYFCHTTGAHATPGGRCRSRPAKLMRLDMPRALPGLGDPRCSERTDRCSGNERDDAAAPIMLLSPTAIDDIRPFPRAAHSVLLPRHRRCDAGRSSDGSPERTPAGRRPFLFLPLAAHAGGALVGAIGVGTLMDSRASVAVTSSARSCCLVDSRHPNATVWTAALPGPNSSLSSARVHQSSGCIASVHPGCGRMPGTPSNRPAAFGVVLAESTSKLPLPRAWSIGAVFPRTASMASSHTWAISAIDRLLGGIPLLRAAFCVALSSCQAHHSHHRSVCRSIGILIAVRRHS